MSELAQNKDVQAEQSTTPEQITENVEIVPIRQVLKITAPDGNKDEIICYGDIEELGNGVTATKARVVPEEIMGFMDIDEPKAKQGSTKRAIAATIAAILGGGAVVSAVSGCISNGEGDTAIKQMKRNMTSDDYNHNFQDEGVACFSQPGDGPASIGELPNGDKIIVFTRDSGGGINHCYGVTAPDYQAAVNTECVAQDVPLEGFMTPGGNPTISSCTADGTRMAAVRGSETVLYDLDVPGGVINASNPWGHALTSNSSKVNFIRDGGQQYLLTNNGGGTVNKTNLDTLTQDPTTVPFDCGLPHKDDAADVWTRSRLSGGDCMVVQSPTLAGLASSITQIQGISGDYQAPRAGDTMFFFNAADGNHYAIVLPYCGDGTCNNGETQATCATDCGTAPACGDGNLDAGEVCDDNNTVDGDGCSADCQSDETCGNNVTDTTVGEACDNGAANSDTAADACRTSCELPSCGDDVTDTGEECDDGNTLDGDGCSAVCETETEPVCGDGTCEPPETNATCPADCPPGPVCGDNVCEPPETNATCAADCASEPACQPFMDDSRIRFVQGAENCELTDCVDTPLEELLTVQGECTFELDFGNANPAEVTIAAANGSADGAYRIDFIEEMGEMLRGQYSVDDNGNELGTTYTKNGNTVATVVEGTKYSGEEITIPENSHDGYRMECSEGQITVYKNGELVTTLNANDSTIVDMEENGTDPDAGVDGGVDSGTDGGTDGGVDAGTTPPKKPSCTEGCNSSKGELPATELAFIGLLLIALARRMRRAREESIMENRPTAPGGILLNHVKRRIGGYFEGLRK